MVSKSVSGGLGGCSFLGKWIENMGMRSGYAHLLMVLAFFISVLIVLKFVGEYGGNEVSGTA